MAKEEEEEGSKVAVIAHPMASSLNVWPDGRPALPDTADWSCHGSLGWTLRQALDQMERTPTTTEDDPNEAEEEESQPRTGSNKKETNDQSRLQGQIQDEHDSQASGNTAESVAAPANSPRLGRLQTTPQMRQAVLEALATAPSRLKDAPHGIIKGRIKYYQRQGTRWRFEVEDVRIRRRLPLRKIRRKQEKPSLWDLSREGRRGKDPPVKKNDAEESKWTFELLAYNDT